VNRFSGVITSRGPDVRVEHVGLRAGPAPLLSGGCSGWIHYIRFRVGVNSTLIMFAGKWKRILQDYRMTGYLTPRGSPGAVLALIGAVGVTLFVGQVGHFSVA